MHICLLAATFNRADKLSFFLNSLDAAFAEIANICTLELFVVNNNSLDQTSYILSFARSYKITELLTPSDLFWAESMSYGYKLIEHNKIDYDYLLSVNDDILLSNDSLVELCKAIKNDQIYDSEQVYLGECTFAGKVTYGCRKLSHRLTLSFSLVDNPSKLTSLTNVTFNMNFLCVSRQVLTKYGYLSSKFRHGVADYYFGLHLFSQNLRLVVLDSPVGICQRDSDDKLLKLASSSRLSMRLLFDWLESPKGFPFNERILLAKKLYPGNIFLAYFLVIKERVFIVVKFLFYSFK